MLLATLSAVLLVILVLAAIVAGLMAACAFALLSLLIGLALRSSRFAWLSPFLIWIPSLTAGFALLYLGFTASAIYCDWPFPGSLPEFITLFVLGELFSLGLGTTIALRTSKLNHPNQNQPPETPA